jgi:DNA polymerase elongation subunit (family B)
LIPYFNAGEVEDKFKGATVVDPLKGFYEEPIPTDDFKSLYPTIMIANNLCYTTLISKKMGIFLLKRRDHLGLKMDRMNWLGVFKDSKNPIKNLHYHKLMELLLKREDDVDDKEIISRDLPYILVRRQMISDLKRNIQNEEVDENGNYYLLIPEFKKVVEQNRKKYLINTRDGPVLNYRTVFPEWVWKSSGGTVQLTQKDGYLIYFEADIVTELQKLADIDNINVSPIGCVFESNRLEESQHIFKRGYLGYKLNQDQSKCFQTCCGRVPTNIEYEPVRNAFVESQKDEAGNHIGWISKCKPNTYIRNLTIDVDPWGPYNDGYDGYDLIEDFFQKVEEDPNQYLTNLGLSNKPKYFRTELFPPDRLFNYQGSVHAEDPNKDNYLVLLDNSVKCAKIREYIISYEDVIKSVDSPIVQNHNHNRLHVDQNGCITDLDRVGILPQILNDLLDARKTAKKLMFAQPEGSFAYTIYDARQLAFKVICNSVYGFTGTSAGVLPCQEISASVTAYGRMLIEETTVGVETYFSVKNGYEHDAVVIYGDTDSVMINFGPVSLDRAFELADQSIYFMNPRFSYPIELEFEKVYYPYLLMKKKKYAGLMFEPKMEWDDEYGLVKSIPASISTPKTKIDSKGIETVRRDICPYVSHTMKEILDRIFIKKDIPGSIEYLKHQVARLYAEEVDYSFLLLSAGLNRPLNEYRTATPHSEVAKKVNRRSPGTYSVNSRISYLFVNGNPTANKGNLAEDPTHVIKTNMELNVGLYLEKLEEPMRRIYEFILKPEEIDDIFVGEHVRRAKSEKEKKRLLRLNSQQDRNGLRGLTALVIKKTKRCQICKIELPGRKNGFDQSVVLCNECKKDKELVMDVIIHSMKKLRIVEKECTALWNTCATCKGDRLEPTVCTSLDSCPIFFVRYAKLNEKNRLIERINNIKDLEW